MGNEHLQVDSNTHYNFGTYLDLPRWNSYYHQIAEVMALAPKSVLIIGVGDNIVGNILSRWGVKVDTFDFDQSLHPDFAGDVSEIGTILQGKKFDLILCCQVLEHLPYEKFEHVLQQFQSISHHVVISLPYSAIKYKIELKLPVLKYVKALICIHQFYKKLEYAGEHYWEIGCKGYPKKRIRRSMEKYFRVDKSYIAPHNLYHLFYVLTSEK